MDEPLPIVSKEFPSFVIPLIAAATHSIDIIVFDWRFYKNDPANAVSLFNTALAHAVRRGVTVRCIVNSEEVAANLRMLGCAARKLETKKILHTKLIILDNVNIVTGSHNYTQHAFCSNFELSVYFKLSEQENAFVKYFNNLFGL